MGKAEELAAAIKRLESGRGKRRHYPEQLRQRIVDYVREQRAAGVALKSIAQVVGVSSTLLHRWDIKRIGKFCRVELGAAPTRASGCVLHAPHGVRVEGLAVDQLADILRRLG